MLNFTARMSPLLIDMSHFEMAQMFTFCRNRPFNGLVISKKKNNANKFEYKKAEKMKPICSQFHTKFARFYYVFVLFQTTFIDSFAKNLKWQHTHFDCCMGRKKTILELINVFFTLKNLCTVCIFLIIT